MNVKTVFMSGKATFNDIITSYQCSLKKEIMKQKVSWVIIYFNKIIASN